MFANTNTFNQNQVYLGLPERDWMVGRWGRAAALIDWCVDAYKELFRCVYGRWEDSDLDIREDELEDTAPRTP